MREQRTLFDLTQDGWGIGKKIQRIYPEFGVSAFVSDVRTEMEGQTLYNVTKAIGRVLRQHLPQNYSDALAILIRTSGSRFHRNRHDTRPPKTISNKIPAATESIIGRRDPK